MEQKLENQAQQSENKAFVVIALFLGVFGLTVLIAIFFTPTLKGQITNLVCGGILFIIGAVAGLKSKFWVK